MLLVFPCFLVGQNLNDYGRGIFGNGNRQLRYRILYPMNFDVATKYPLLIFLHGAFEKGSDNEAQLNIGGRYFLADSNRRNFPALIVFPQCPVDDSWAYFETELDSSTGRLKKLNFPFSKEPTEVGLLLKELLDSLINLSFVDKSKVYVGGLSQGGMGVYDLIARYPNVFTAAFPICGAGKISTASKFAPHTAVWIFHAIQLLPRRLQIRVPSQCRDPGPSLAHGTHAGRNRRYWLG